ncbi:Ubiquitin carboxyl-terminal hydrolase 47 [Chamberlinius hualienensis]
MVPGDNTKAVPLDDVSKTADEPMALCIIRDTTQWTSAKYTLNLPASTTGQKFLEEVSRRSRYEMGTFELILQTKPDGDYVIVNDHPNHNLQEMGFRCGGKRRNTVVIGGYKNEQPKKLEEAEDEALNLDDLSLDTSSSRVQKRKSYPLMEADIGRWMQQKDSNVSSDARCTPGTDYGANDGCQLIRPGIEFVGLVNQAMTCYLNSLLQTLYMTPEFRNALYRWEFDGTEEEKCKSIPYQLQRLFLLLQTSKRHAVETTELTKSFGWDSSEAWQQHDVQELCRVMFDALEQKFKNTDQADLINRLYQGKIRDYVKCLDCGHESAREDSYLDIPLPVKPFGASTAFGSVEEALQAFVQPEVLNGSNQYFCERCDRKCDAHKGLKFSTFPYILTLQLKRFDFDYTTLHRIKLNDKVTFPEILNLNCLMKSEAETLAETNDDASTTDSGSALDEDRTCQSANPANSQTNNSSPCSCNNQEDDEGIEVESTAGSIQNSHEVSANERNWKNSLSLEKGQYLYELFSIMVHSGSANGGHYYAYIKSFKDGQWYCFNDQTVSRITYEDICKTYGGGPPRSFYSGSYSCSTNAYMLFYRQVNKQWNAETMSVEDFPDHIKEILRKMEEQEELERQQREAERNMCKFKLFWNSNVLRRMSETILKIHKDTTLKETTRTAHTILGLEGLVPLDRCRLVKYDDNLDSLESSFEGCDDSPIGELMGGPKSNFKYSLLLEVWPPGKPVPVYKPGGTTVKVYAINLDNEEVESPVTVRSYLNDTVEDFKNQIVQELQLPNKSPQVVLERYYNDLRTLNDPLKNLKAEGFYRSNKVFVEKTVNQDKDVGAREFLFQKILDRYEHTICLNITLPDVSSEYIAKHLCGYSSEGDVAVVNGTDSSETSKPSDFSKDEMSPKETECDAKHSGCNCLSINSGDQSEDSSLTDSDRTMIGDDLSNGLHPLANIENDLKAKSCVSSCNSSVSPQECVDEIDLSSPDENGKDMDREKDSSYAWDEGSEDSESNKNIKRYFRAVQFTDPTTNSKMLRVHVDKRITLGALKTELEQYVGVVSDCFKVFRIYSNNQEFECTRLNETLVPYSDDAQMVVKVGRALRKGEFRVKIFQFLINEPEPAVFLIDWIVVKGVTVLQTKKEILPEIKSNCNLDVPLNRCRLRKKHWRTPATIFIDSQRFDDDISIYDNSEIYLEVLSEPEKVTSSSQLSLYTRRWSPSSYTLGPIKEIVLDDYSLEQLKAKLSEISEIPSTSIDFAKIQGNFPGEVSLLTIQSDLDWNPQVTMLNMWPLYICDDGFVICYKDNREATKPLGDNERREIISRENAKLHRSNYCGHSPRKERALKIYTDTSPIRTKAIVESTLD